MDNQNNFTSGTLTKSKNNKNKLIMIIIAVIALIAVLGGGVVYAIVNVNPKVKVFNALKATSDDLKNKETLTDKIAGKNYLKDLQEKGINQNMKFTVKSTNSIKLKSLTGVGLSFDSSFDQKNKKFMMDMGGEYKGTSVAKAQFYTDNKKLMVSAPDFYNAWFTCDAEDIQSQYNNSVFVKSGKSLNQNFSLKVFGEDGDVVLNEEFFNQIMTGYLKTNAGKLATIGKNAKVEKSKQTKKIEIGGATQECSGYDVVISGKDAKDFITGIYDYILQDENIKKAMIQQVRYSYMQQRKKYNSPEAMIDDFYAELKKGREELESNITFDDVNAKIYLDKKGRAVSIESNTTINSKKCEKVQVKFLNDFKGKDNVGDIIDMSMELSSAGETVKMDFDNSNITNGDIINEEMKLVLSSENAKINVNAKSNYNTKNGDFDGSADLGFDDEGINLSYNGNTQYDKSSKKLALDFDKIDLNMNVNHQKLNLSLDGSYSMAPLENPIEEPTGEKLELFKLSQDKCSTILQEMQSNATKVASTLMK